MVDPDFGFSPYKAIFVRTVAMIFTIKFRSLPDSGCNVSCKLSPRFSLLAMIYLILLFFSMLVFR